MVSCQPCSIPFAGGGSIPLEANRLGFEAHAGDLNPVAALLNKCNLEIAYRGGWVIAPVSILMIVNQIGWRQKDGEGNRRALAADIRYYAELIGQRDPAR